MPGKLYMYLVRNEITQRDLARRVGVDFTYIARIANQRVSPGVGLALRIAGALGCQVEDIFEVPQPAAEPT